MISSHGKLPFAIIVAIYAICTLLVNPLGEFPLNDDWSYSRSAFTFASSNRIQVDEWCAMSLIGQAVYGGALVKVFGRHFLVLRVSTLALSCGTALLLWAVVRRIGVTQSLSWVAVLTWIFNPIQFCLAFTFMTEIPFLFFVMLALFLFALGLQTRRRWLLPVWAAASGFGFLIRQTAVLFAGPAILALLWENREQIPSVRRPNRPSRTDSSGKIWLWHNLSRPALAAAVMTPFIAGYYLWVQNHGGPTPATRRKFELLRYLSVGQLTGNTLGILFYLSFLLLPILIYSLPLLCRICRKYRSWARLWFFLPWAGVASFGLWWFRNYYSRTTYLPGSAFHSQMPILLNVLYDSGLGPVTLDPTYYGPPATPIHPHIWFCLTIATALGVAILGGLCTIGTLKLWSYLKANTWTPLLAAMGLAVFAVTVFEIVFSHLQEGGLFDRHLLIIALPMTILLGAICTGLKGSLPESRDHSLAPLAAAVLLLSAWFCVTATHDYLEWNRVRWDLGNYLLAEGVDPLALSAGFEFNAWHNYDIFRARGNVGKVYYWWYDRRDYLISMSPEAGYGIMQQKTYYSWLHRRPVSLYALKAEGPERAHK